MSRHQEFEYFEAEKDAVTIDVHPGPIQLLDHPKDHSEGLVEFNHAEEGKKGLAFES